MNPSRRSKSRLAPRPAELNGAPACYPAALSRPDALLTEPGSNVFAGSAGRLLLATMVVAVAATLRIPGLYTDFWLDEVWSLERALAIESPLEVFTAIRTFNNHHLNSLVLFAIGDRQLGEPPWLIYRLPALAAGIGSVILAGALARRRAPQAGWLALLLAGTSFPLVYYSSEARGYSFLVFFALLSLLLLLRYDESGLSRYKYGYWASSVLGFLSQLVYLFFFMGALAWSYLRQGRRAFEGENLPTPKLVRLHDLPLLALLVLFIVDLRHSDFGAAVSFSGVDVFVSTVSMAIGGPPGGAVAYIACAVAFFVVALELTWLRREGSELWVLFATAMVVFPLLVTLAARPQYMSPRYFLVGIALFQLLLAGFLARTWRAGTMGRLVVVAALGLAVGGNMLNLMNFWSSGRGGYSDAVRWIADRNPEASVGSASDLTRVMIDYYSGIEQEADGVRYLSVEQRPIGGWDWWVERRLSNATLPPSEITDEAGVRYTLERSYPVFWLSGVAWHLYARHEDD